MRLIRLNNLSTQEIENISLLNLILTSDGFPGSLLENPEVNKFLIKDKKRVNKHAFYDPNYPNAL